MGTFVVGLTGGIASGKSLVEALFRRLGVPVLDADQVSREVVRPRSEALSQIAATFGPEFLLGDGALNRTKMRMHVFSNPEARRKLEEILHPPMFDHIEAWLEATAGAYCMISAATLLESGLFKRVDRIVVVDVPVDMQRERLVHRDGISEALAEQMLAVQLPREKRLSHAHDVIDNSTTIASTEIQVLKLHGSYGQLGRVKHSP